MEVFLGWIFFSIVVAVVASHKGRSGWGWFFISLLISPIISLIVLLIIGDSEEKKEENLKKTVDVIEKRKSEINRPEGQNLTQEQAMAELKKAKELLDLQVISQEEYDKKKAELTPILLAKSQKIPAPDSSQDNTGKTPTVNDAYRYYAKFGTH